MTEQEKKEHAGGCCKGGRAEHAAGCCHNGAAAGAGKNDGMQKGSDTHDGGHAHGKKKPELKDHVSREEAIEKLFAVWDMRTDIESVHVSEACTRTLAEDIFALYDQPVVRASAMDGVAVRSADFANGMPDTSKWQPGTDYVRADTGDDFDDAFDSVIRIENVKILENGGIKIAEDEEFYAGMNVMPRGNNIKKGTQVAKEGDILTPAALAAIILAGHGDVKVRKKPVFAFIPTGSELVPAGSVLARGQNFDSNSIMVKTTLERMGAEVVLHPIIKDDPAAVKAALDKMIDEADVVILNAGTSKGSEDYCVTYLEKNGKMLFHGVRAVPGRPMSITIYKDKPVINMSGPSVGALNGCYWFLPAVIDRMLGHTEPMYLPQAEVILKDDLSFAPFFSTFCGLMLSKGEDGMLYAQPMPKSMPRSAALVADAFYLSKQGEEPKSAGDRIKVFLAK